VRESVPTKEGLRRTKKNGNKFCSRCERISSNKRRIATDSYKLVLFAINVRESVPTKEGLRRCVVENIELDSHLWENQFQQKKDCDRKYRVGQPFLLYCERISSNKRRIATFQVLWMSICPSLWENQFQQKKDCDLIPLCSKVRTSKWENQFQQKKDCDLRLCNCMQLCKQSGERISSNKRRIATVLTSA